MKHLNKQRSIALGTLGVLSATLIGGAFTSPAQADSKTWKKAAIGAGAVTAYGLLKHNGTATTLGAIGTVGSYLKYRSDKKKEDKKKHKYSYYRSHHRRR